MSSQFDESEFVDTDYQLAHKSAYGNAGGAALAGNRPPTREEIESKVSQTHQKLAELKRAQEELERERASLEEARRRRIEFQTGREEMLHHLTRGVALLEEGEFAARREAEQMNKSLGELREALAKVQSLNEEAWTQENWNTELTRALTTLENARMEWNSARLKFSLLNGEAATKEQKTAGPGTEKTLALDQMGFWQLCKLGLALNWPGLVIALAALATLLLLLLR